MRKQMIENAAFEVATQVRAVEDSIESALAEIAELQGRMVPTRATTGVAFTTSHAAFEQLATAVTSLVAARGGMANCHAALADTKQHIPGLRRVGFGDQGDCPENTRTSGQLRIVA